MGDDRTPRYFTSAAAFRRWLAAHHAREAFLWVGFWKVSSGRRGLTYEEAVDEALCFGWIDGVVNRVDEASYMHRFAPRTKKSIWSSVNLAKYAALEAAGRVAPAGRATYEGRDPARAGLYSFENRHVTLDAAFERRFRAERRAWAFFEAQPPGYRRLAAFWVMSAKQPQTRERRFAQLVDDAAKGLRVRSIAGDTPASATKLP